MSHAVELAPPRDWQVFEDFCRDLFAAEWGDPGTQKHGRPGQQQHGVDVVGRRQGRWQGVQCKRRRVFPEIKLRESEVRAEVEAARELDPPLEMLVIATTAPPDIAIQALAARITEDLGAAGPRVVVYGWSELCELLRRHRDEHELWQGRLGVRRDRFWNVPNRNPYFTGREELLEALAARLEAAGKVALTQAITGLGGVGKTQTAIEFAHRHRERYGGGVYWADASSSEALHGSYAGFAVARGLARPDEPVQEASERFRRRLGERDGWLLVLDNADAPEQVRALLPQTTTGHVIVTTRAEVPELGRDPLPVDVLPEAQAVEFLLERAGRRDAERTVLGELAEALGRLPLALEQAGAYLARHRVAVADYLASFRQRRMELLEEQNPIQGGYGATVASTWEISFRQVEEASPASAEALRACAFLAPDAIPLELFVTTGDRLGPALGALAVAAAGDRLVLHEQLVEPLTRYSLVSHQAHDGGLLSIHRLVQVVIRHGLGAGGREKTHERVHLALDARFPQDPDAPRSWEAGALWLPHVVSLLARWREATREPGFDPTALWMRAAHNASSAGRADAARELGEEALADRRRLLGEEHPDTLASMNNLAETLRVLGDASGARELHEEALPIRRRVLGEEHPDTLTSINNLALSLWALGDASGARELTKEVLAVRRRVLGKEHPDTLTSMSSLAVALRDLGDASGARELHKEALAVYRRVLGEEHPHTFTSMHNFCVLAAHDGMEVDPEMVKSLLEGVRKLPEGTPIRVAAEKRWGSFGE